LLQRRPALREKNRKLVARTGRKKGPRLMKSGRNEKSKNSETERVQERERESEADFLQVCNKRHGTQKK
jgi:hypothetical protein